MIDVAPGQLYTAEVEGAPPGLVGTMGVRLEDGSGNVVTPRTTADIVELAPGVYSTDTLLAPLQGGDYIVIWDDGADPLMPDDVATETVRVAYAPSYGVPPSGIGPFASGGQVQDRQGNVLVELACTVRRRAPGSPSSVGEQYDYQGIASINGADALVEKDNRLLIVGADTYRVVDARRYDALPHLELSLRKVTG